MRSTKVSYNNVKLEDIYTDNGERFDYLKSSLYIPQMEISNNEIFIKTSDKIVRNMGGIDYVRFILLDDNYMKIGDEDYQFIELKRGKYLMKLVVPSIPANADSLYIDYIVDINDIHMDSFMNSENDQIITSFTSTDLTEVSERLDPSLIMTPENKSNIFKKYFKYQFNIR